MFTKNKSNKEKTNKDKNNFQVNRVVIESYLEKIIIKIIKLNAKL